MATQKLHSICRWTFHAGKGGFQPGNIRPSWGSAQLSSAGFVKIVREKIAPRLPKHIELGVEFHFDTEINQQSVAEVAEAMQAAKLSLAMITPGAHSHYGYGGICSLDPREREEAGVLGKGTVDLAYGALKSVWNKDCPPTLVLWNGAYGYDLASSAVKEMYQNLKKGLADLCKYEASKGGELYIGIEPKPNEGHPAMLLPTVASVIVLWRKIADEFGVSLAKKGLNKEFGHSEMIGLDHVYDTVEELDNNMVVHTHLNSQGYNDGIILGGPGKYDIDHGTRINGMNIAIAQLLQEAGYKRWFGHDMQPRPYDNEIQSVDRVVRSILSWEACEQAAAGFKKPELLKLLAARETAKAEDMIRDSVTAAYRFFDEMYGR